MIERDRLLSIQDLKLAGRIENMDDNQMGYYEQLLVSYIENFPEHEKKIKSALDAKEYGALLKSLDGICEELRMIYASDIAGECSVQCSELKEAMKDRRVNDDKVEAYVTHFLSATAMLSIDIQMAKYLEKKKEIPRETETKTEEPPGKKLSEKIILAVDDASISLNMLKKILQVLPCKLTCVNSGEEALRFIQINRPDLFLLDIEMPKMNGYELAERLRGNGQDAPIIFLTGNATREYLKRAIQMGAADFIAKPLDKKYLLYKVNKHINKTVK